MRFIVAYDYKAYRHWCREQNPPLNPDGPEARYVKDERTLRGVAQGFEYLCLQGWSARRDWREIYNALLSRGRQP